MAKLGDLVARIGADTKGFNKALGDVQRRSRQMSGNIKNLGKQMSMSITGPLALIGASSVKTFMSFEAQMAKVKAVSGATADEFSRLEANAKQLGASTRFSASEVAELQTEFAKLGFTADEITKVTGATLALAQATDSDLARAAEVAGSTLRAFGLDASETGRVADVMALSFSSSALDMEAFAESMKYVAPVANSAGMSIEQTTAMLGALANAGIKGSQAGTALRRIISELGATGGDVAGAIDNLAKKGLNLADAKDEVGRSAQSALLVLSKEMQTVDSLQTSLNGAAGSAQKMASIMDATASGGLARMRSAIEAAQISLGQALAPAVEKIMSIISDLASKFAALDSSTQTFIVGIGAAAAAIGPLLVLIPSLISAVSTLGPAFGALAAAATGPIGITVAAIAGLGAAIYYLWDDVKGPILNLVNSFIELYNNVAAVRVVVAVLVQNFKNQFTVLKQAILSVIDYFALMADVLATAVTDGVGAAFDKLTTGLGEIGGDIIGTAEQIGEDTIAAMQSAVEKEPIEFVTEESFSNLKERLMGLIPSFESGGKAASEAFNRGLTIPQEMQMRGQTVTPTATLQTGNYGEMLPTEDFKDFEKKLDTIDQKAKSVGQSVSGAFQQMGQKIVAGLGLADDGFEGFAKSLSGTVIELMGMYLSQSIAAAIAAGSNAGAATGPAAPATTPAFIATLVGGVMSAFAAIPAFADGGVVSGPTMGLMGEYSGARNNPEVIAPLDKLRGMIADVNGDGSGGGTLSTRVKGSDLVFILERGQKQVNRNR
jgi:phage-related minor tail protein